MFEVEFTVDQDDDDKGRVYWSDIDYGFVFHPVEMIALGWHAGLETEGCVLPIYDDNLESGKFGSDGFTLQVTPVDGLRLAVSVPFGEGRKTATGQTIRTYQISISASVRNIHWLTSLF